MHKESLSVIVFILLNNTAHNTYTARLTATAAAAAVIKMSQTVNVSSSTTSVHNFCHCYTIANYHIKY